VSSRAMAPWTITRTWRDAVAELKAAYDYEGKDIAPNFDFVTETTGRSSPQSRFEYRYRERALPMGFSNSKA
jgi:hypothetical protein